MNKPNQVIRVLSQILILVCLLFEVSCKFGQTSQLQSRRQEQPEKFEGASCSKGPVTPRTLGTQLSNLFAKLNRSSDPQLPPEVKAKETAQLQLSEVAFGLYKNKLKPTLDFVHVAEMMMQSLQGTLLGGAEMACLTLALPVNAMLPAANLITLNEVVAVEQVSTSSTTGVSLLMRTNLGMIRETRLIADNGQVTVHQEPVADPNRPIDPQGPKNRTKMPKKPGVKYEAKNLNEAIKNFHVNRTSRRNTTGGGGAELQVIDISPVPGQSDDFIVTTLWPHETFSFEYVKGKFNGTDFSMISQIFPLRISLPKRTGGVSVSPDGMFFLVPHDLRGGDLDDLSLKFLSNGAISGLLNLNVIHTIRVQLDNPKGPSVEKVFEIRNDIPVQIQLERLQFNPSL